MTQPSSPRPATRTVRCPACGGPSLFAPENRFRPFCSERCKLHDLGAWASESFRVEAQESDGAEVPLDGGGP
ncbi:MAG: DNA gyrase inhibitor YacG [Burkholderiales bacterium]|nr:DNA gyrase inhibitor YacG [Burkholderiales bacterium]